LELFDLAWNALNSVYAAFQNLEVDWDSLRSVYRPEIEAGVSRGRFAAIMNHLTLALEEMHTCLDDIGVNQSTPLDPGIPLFVIGAWTDNTHFGASLTPLPDSSLLVFKAVPSHPLGLVAGDIVLGYDGIPWKILYKQLLQAKLPLFRTYLWGSSEEAITHNMLMSAGMNWHLFDTLDVVKYATGETLHLSTEPLDGQNGFIWGNQQLPVPGVPWPDITGEGVFRGGVVGLGDYVSWGIVEGTQIGYIYVIGWFANSALEFYNAVDSLMNHYETTGLIIDNRLNYGGSITAYHQGLSLLFNSTIETVAFDYRCGDPNNHYQMCPSMTYTSTYCAIPGDSQTFYDKPIALLTGPGAMSGGDQFALGMKLHPMTRIFGKPTAGGFSMVSMGDLTGNGDWEFLWTSYNSYLVSDPSSYLTHTGLEVDEEIWLTQDDVARDEDTVVKRAIDWIQSMASVQDGEDVLPTGIALHQNYPNPFNPMSTICYELPQASEVSLIVYDILGREVVRLVDGYMEPGTYSVVWNGRGHDGSEVPSGIYITRLVTAEYSKSIKMVYLK
jgi:hypothetical protein